MFLAPPLGDQPHRCTVSAASKSSSLPQDGRHSAAVQVGGDGLFQEAVNGLIQLRARSEGPASEQAAALRLGHIPAGSTDAVAYSIHGTRDVTTAALHIVTGDRLAPRSWALWRCTCFAEHTELLCLMDCVDPELGNGMHACSTACPRPGHAASMLHSPTCVPVDAGAADTSRLGVSRGSSGVYVPYCRARACQQPWGHHMQRAAAVSAGSLRHAPGTPEIPWMALSARQLARQSLTLTLPCALRLSSRGSAGVAAAVTLLTMPAMDWAWADTWVLSRLRMDVMRVDSADGDHRFAMCTACYGYMGDLMATSERLRWLGPSRYNLAGRPCCACFDVSLCVGLLVAGLRWGTDVLLLSDSRVPLCSSSSSLVPQSCWCCTRSSTA